MYQSTLFSRVQREFPEGEESLNARLLIRGGFVHKLAAGVYAYLPLGLRVLQKINSIVRREMNALGAEEMLMSALIKKEYWQKSGRWDVPIMYTLKHGVGDEEVGLGWTHEEVISAIAENFIFSYRDLPRAVYQIQTKFRKEARAKSGLLRNREFLMKDLYSFHRDSEDLNAFYEKTIEAYKKVFKAVGLEARLVEASGSEFTKEYTHEFQVFSPAGEDIVFYCNFCDFAQNKEIFDEKIKNCIKCKKGAILSASAIEVGNVFKLGTRYSDKFNLQYTDEKGARHSVVMGSYGIGQSRLMGTIAEMYNDTHGLMWPLSVAPFVAHIVGVGNDANVRNVAEALHGALEKKGIEILYDDRDLSPGEKFQDADFMGIPTRIVVSQKTCALGKVEVKKRGENEIRFVTPQEAEGML